MSVIPSDQKKVFGAYLLPTPSRIIPPLSRVLLRRPVLFLFWLHLRRLRHWLAGVPMRRMSFDERTGEPHIANNVIPHNLEQLWSINSDRTERLMNVFKSIQGLEPAKLRVLCVGPRNEAELLLLAVHGFDLDKVSAVDLFSYSPLIRVMDMHKLEFPDGVFDVVYMSYVLTYSDKTAKALEEACRVLRDGGLMALSFQHFVDGGVNRFGFNMLGGGLKELFSHLSGRLGHIYWQEEFREGRSVTCSTVFRVSKAS